MLCKGWQKVEHLARLLLSWVGPFESKSQMFVHTQLAGSRGGRLDKRKGDRNISEE